MKRPKKKEQIVAEVEFCDKKVERSWSLQVLLGVRVTRCCELKHNVKVLTLIRKLLLLDHEPTIDEILEQAQNK